MMSDVIRTNTSGSRYNLDSILFGLNLEKLEEIFKSNKKNSDIGLTKAEFSEAMAKFQDNISYGISEALHEKITCDQKETVNWIEFLDFLLQHMSQDMQNPVSLQLRSIEPVAHSKNETIIKIVSIEIKQYFCYAIVLKYGTVGLYDGHLNFLTSYHVIMTPEDLTRPEDERRKRNRWVTDAIFCPDTLLFIVTNTTRSIAIYEASALKHVPLWLILGIPTILECLSYKQWDSCTLFLGDSNGYVRSLKFLQPKIGFLKKKGNDNVGIFYWQNLRKEKEFVIVRKHGKLHNGPVKQIEYFQDLRLLITCCKDPNTAIVITSIENIKKNEIYRIAKGVNCFALDPIKKILFTGSDSGIIEIWNIFLSKFMAKLVAHNSEIIDIIVIQSEHLLITYSIDAVLKLWDLVEYTCLQTIELQFSSFNINGKTTEWGIKNIFPGPPRQNSNQTQKKENPNEVYIKEELPFNNNIWEKSCILVTCCNYIANLETYFTNSNIQLTFPILAPPPLQNSVLIPIGWGLLKDEGIIESGDVQSNKNCEQLEKLKFILERNLLEENETKSSINYQIAMLESKKEKMVSKVALGAPYLSLDLYDIETIKLSSNLPINKKTEPYMKKINCLIQNATIRDNAFLYSESSSSNRSKSTKSSIFTLTPH